MSRKLLPCDFTLANFSCLVLLLWAVMDSRYIPRSRGNVDTTREGDQEWICQKWAATPDACRVANQLRINGCQESSWVYWNVQRLGWLLGMKYQTCFSLWCYFQWCPWEISSVERAGQRGDGQDHPQGEDCMAVSGIGYGKPRVCTGCTFSLILHINGLRKQSSYLVGPPYLAWKVVHSLDRQLLAEIWSLKSLENRKYRMFKGAVHLNWHLEFNTKYNNEIHTV